MYLDWQSEIKCLHVLLSVISMGNCFRAGDQEQVQDQTYLDRHRQLFVCTKYFPMSEMETIGCSEDSFYFKNSSGTYNFRIGNEPGKKTLRAVLKLKDTKGIPSPRVSEVNLDTDCQILLMWKDPNKIFRLEKPRTKTKRVHFNLVTVM